MKIQVLGTGCARCKNLAANAETALQQLGVEAEIEKVTAIEEIAAYQELLQEHMIKPVALQVWIMRADGSGKRQLTHNTAANFAPFFFPGGNRIIFSSNMDTADGGMGNFELYAINRDGSGLERITFSDGFDGFPMFSPDGKKLAFSSNRNATRPHETNVFIADWVE